MRSLEEINQLYGEIIKEAEPIRSRRLAALMDVMEKDYQIQIPMLKNEASYEEANKEVLEVYRKIIMGKDLRRLNQ